MEEKYTKLLNTFERIILNTKNEELKNSAKESYVTFIYYLAVLEKKDLKVYEEMMQSLNIPEDAIKNTLDRINVFQLKKDNSNEFEQEDEILKENDKVIENEPIKENVVEKNVNPTSDTTIEEYILTNVYRNKNQNIGNEHQKLVLKLQEDLKNPNDKLIKTWVSNYMSFIEKYKNELDKDKLVEYMHILFKQYDKENKYIDKLPEFIKEIENGNIAKEENIEAPTIETTKEIKQEKEAEPLKILNVKKSFKSKKELAVLGASALVGGLVFGTSGMLVLPIAAIIYKIYKNKRVTNNKLKKFLKKNNYTIDEETQELKDSNGEVITDEKINKSKYEMIKQYLLKLNTKKQDGDIKTEYKKNKMASKLLNTKFVEKLKNITKRNELEEPKEVEELEENQEIQKGMGLC